MVHINNLKAVMKNGWIAKEKSGEWFWHKGHPSIVDKGWISWDGCSRISMVFNIEDDEINWKKSCQKVGV